MTCYIRTDFENYTTTLYVIIWWQKSFFIVFYMRNCIWVFCVYILQNLILNIAVWNTPIEYRSMKCFRCLLLWFSCAFGIHFRQFIVTWNTMEQCEKSLSCMEHAFNLNVIFNSICDQIKLHLLHMQKDVCNYWSIKKNRQTLNNKSM